MSAEVTSDVAGPTGQIVFTKLVVRDLDAQTGFYGTVLGYSPVQKMTGEVHGRPVEEVLLGGPEGSPVLLLMRYTDGGAQPDSTGIMLGVGTADLSGFGQVVVQAGGTVVRPAGPVDIPGSSMQMAIFADPEGFLLEVIETG